MKRTKKVEIKKLILDHLSNNKKEYILIFLIFIIGMFLGVMFINNCKDTQQGEIKQYLEQFITTLKNTEKLNTKVLLKNTLKENMLLAVSLWFFGTTIIGIPIVFGIILYRGFCLGYTISTIIVTLGTKKGILFIFSSIFLQNIIFIPCLIALGVSGYKLYKSIIRNRRRENIKIEVLRHTIFSLIILGLLCISAIIEILISTNFLQKIIKNF